MPEPNDLGGYLKSARQVKNFTLRAVEREAGISNAYLSQLESGKIKNPSPNVLHKLSELYGLPYARIMTKAGYPMPDVFLENSANLGLAARLGPTTEEEEEAIVEYVEFLRTIRNRGKK